MPTPDHNFELRQLLKAYRKGLISDEIFEEQLTEINGRPVRPLAAPPPPARVWKSQGKIFHAERDLVVHFLDELRAGEAFGGTIFDLWQRVASDPGLRGTLRAIGAREAMHGVMLAARLSELGGAENANLPASFAETTRARLASTDVSDAEKLKEVLARLPDIETATGPLREVIEQIEDDIESRSLLELIVADEESTVSCLRDAARRLGLGLPDEKDA